MCGYKRARGTCGHNATHPSRVTPLIPTRFRASLTQQLLCNVCTFDYILLERRTGRIPVGLEEFILLEEYPWDPPPSAIAVMI